MRTILAVCLIASLVGACSSHATRFSDQSAMNDASPCKLQRACGEKLLVFRDRNILKVGVDISEERALQILVNNPGNVGLIQQGDKDWPEASAYYEKRRAQGHMLTYSERR